MAADRFRQLQLLLWKNWLFIIRSWKTTLLQLLAPCFFLVLVTVLSFLPQGLEDVTNPQPVYIGKLPQCQGWNGKPCVTLLTIGLNLTVPTQINVSDLTNLELNDETQDCIRQLMDGFANASNLSRTEISDNIYLNDTKKALVELGKSNYTQVALLFTECSTDENNPKLNYTIIYNATRALKLQQLIFGSPNKPDGRAEIQITLDQVFMNIVLNKPVEISVQAETFPKLFQRESIEAKQAQSATGFLFCAITIQFVMMLYNVVSEKDLKLRQGLKLIGLKDSIYWIAWAITGLVIALLSTCVLMVTGYACQLQYFLNTNFIINFLLFFIYSGSMVPLAFFASVFINTIKLAVSVGIMIFVIGLMVIGLLGNPFLLTQLYINVKPLVYVLSFLPPFHLAKAMADIGLAGSDTDSNGLPQESHYYGWPQLFKAIDVEIFKFNSSDDTAQPYLEHYTLPPTYQSLIYLVANAVLYGVLFWYLDNVISGNHSIPRKWYFFLQPSYWFDSWYGNMKLTPLLSPPTSPQHDGMRRRIEIDAGQREDGVSNEHQPLLNRQDSYGSSDDTTALEIDQLTKIFSSGILCCARQLPPAVNNLSLSVQQDTILSLLGHNGAGKSTTINMLTGLLEPNDGDAFFYGTSVRRNLDEIRSMLGVCPQHDVLWADLTAREHMELFAGMKNVPKQNVKTEIQEILQEVQLDHVADHRVNTFSGGMKRRLSVAMCFLGDPRIVFLDEPTTGMDPKIRRNIWNMIIKKKTNRVIIMTTHSMEEADILGDSIAILANGYLRVMGTSVNLKNRFAGYIIELVVKRDSVQDIMDLVTTQLTGATLKSDPLEVEEGVLLPYSLPPDCQRELVPFFKVIENESQIANVIIDYSISQTTLEEVFMNVTLNELFRDKQYQPLLRSASYPPSSPLT